MPADLWQDVIEIAGAMQVQLHGQDILVAGDSARLRAYHRSVLGMIGAAGRQEAGDGDEGFGAVFQYVTELLNTDHDMALHRIESRAPAGCET